jgi:hypothetical protein
MPCRGRVTDLRPCEGTAVDRTWPRPIRRDPSGPAGHTQRVGQSMPRQGLVRLQLPRPGNGAQPAPTGASRPVLGAETGGVGRSGAIRSSGRPAAGLPREGGGSRTRNVALRDGSSIGAASVAQVLPRFVDEPIQSTGANIGFELPVPFLRVKLSKPSAKRDSLFVGQPADSFFELLHRAHISRLQSARQIKSLSLQVAVGLSLTGILTPPIQPVKDAARVFAPWPLLLGVMIVRASSAFLTTPAREIGARVMASGPDIEDNGLAYSLRCSREVKRLGRFVPDRSRFCEVSAPNRDR